MDRESYDRSSAVQIVRSRSIDFLRKIGCNRESKTMREYIYDVLKLTAVECLADISLPDLGFVPEMLSEQLAILGMVKPELKVTDNFAPRGRNASDPPYSLDAFARAGVGIELRV